MPANSQRSKKDMIVTRFATTPAIPTYHIVIVLVRLSVFTLIDFELWGRSQATEYLTYAASTIKNVTEAFANGQPYKKYLDEPHFAIPGWLGDEIDKWYMVFYR